MIKKVKKGFTLIELVVVIAVIAILSAVSVVAYVGITNNAKKSAASQEASELKTLIRAELTREDYVFNGETLVGYTEQKNADSQKTFVLWTYSFSYDAQKDEFYAKYESPTFEYYANATTTSKTTHYTNNDAKTDANLFNGIEQLLWVAQGHSASDAEQKDNYIVGNHTGTGHKVLIEGDKLVFEHTNGNKVDVMSFAKN